MKLIIDISENLYFLIQNKLDFNGMLKEKDIYNLMNIIDDAIPIPDNATNGDVIKAMFPNTEVDDYDYGKDPVIDVYGIDNTEYITLRKAWWNAPYKAESENKW